MKNTMFWANALHEYLCFLYGGWASLSRKSLVPLRDTLELVLSECSGKKYGELSKLEQVYLYSLVKYSKDQYEIISMYLEDEHETMNQLPRLLKSFQDSLKEDYFSPLKVKKRKKAAAK